VGEVAMLVEAFKHYSKYASQALKVAMPKGGMRGDINPRHMQQVRQAGPGAVWWVCEVKYSKCVDTVVAKQGMQRDQSQAGGIKECVGVVGSKCVFGELW
jgi:hypothetical protein